MDHYRLPHCKEQIDCCNHRVVTLLAVRKWLPYSQKIWQGIKFGSLVVRVETTKLKSANIIFAHLAPVYVSCTYC